MKRHERDHQNEHRNEHRNEHQGPLPLPHDREQTAAEAAAEDRFTHGDPLWELLGQARESEVSPFFARNVARAARLEAAREEERPLGAFIAALRILLRWRTVAMAAPAIAIALITIASFTQELEWSPGNTAAFAPSDINDQTNQFIDFDIINNLDELLAMEESSEETALWLNVP